MIYMFIYKIGEQETRRGGGGGGLLAHQAKTFPECTVYILI